MKLLRLIFLFFTLSFSSFLLTAQVAVLNFEQLAPRLEPKDNTTWVVNFWATWCAPCVKEMPYFEEIGKKYADKDVKVLLVSLDMDTQLNSRVIPFIEQHNIKSEVILLNDTRANRWIPKVDESWTGAIPATLIFNQTHRSFYEKPFEYDELEAAVKEALSN
jgi:thiol-disulfide isomerase/thioredoxin